jgi:hypothetical protein
MQSEVATEIAGLEPSYSAREAAAVLNRSYSWLDQRLRRGSSYSPMAPECSRCDPRAGTGTSPSPWFATSRHAASAAVGFPSAN